MRLVVLLILSIFLIQFSCAPDYYIEYVKMQGDNWFEVTYRGALSKNDLSQWKIEPDMNIEISTFSIFISGSIFH